MSDTPADGGQPPALEPPANVLLCDPYEDPHGEQGCADLLAPFDPERTDVLVVSVTRSPGDRLRVLRRHLDAPPANLGVVSVADGVRSAAMATSGGATSPAGVPVRTVSDPGDLTGIQIAVTEFLSEWRGNGNRVVCCVHSLTALLQFAPLERSFRFLDAFTGQLTRAGALAHCHASAESHDGRELEAMASVFDHVMVPDDDGDGYETLGGLGPPTGEGATGDAARAAGPTEGATGDRPTTARAGTGQPAPTPGTEPPGDSTSDDGSTDGGSPDPSTGAEPTADRPATGSDADRSVAASGSSDAGGTEPPDGDGARIGDATGADSTGEGVSIDDDPRAADAADDGPTVDPDGEPSDDDGPSTRADDGAAPDGEPDDREAPAATADPTAGPDPVDELGGGHAGGDPLVAGPAAAGDDWSGVRWHRLSAPDGRPAGRTVAAVAVCLLLVAGPVGLALAGGPVLPGAPGGGGDGSGAGHHSALAGGGVPNASTDGAVDERNVTPTPTDAPTAAPDPTEAADQPTQTTATDPAPRPSPSNGTDPTAGVVDEVATDAGETAGTVSDAAASVGENLSDGVDATGDDETGTPGDTLLTAGEGDSDATATPEPTDGGTSPAA